MRSKLWELLTIVLSVVVAINLAGAVYLYVELRDEQHKQEISVCERGNAIRQQIFIAFRDTLEVAVGDDPAAYKRLIAPVAKIHNDRRDCSKIE